MTLTGKGYAGTELGLVDAGLGGQVPSPAPEPSHVRSAPREAARGQGRIPQSPGGAGPAHTLVSGHTECGRGLGGGLRRPLPDSNMNGASVLTAFTP